MAWDEAGRLAAMLCKDPSSALFAALAGWEHPMSREALLAADTFDLLHQVNTDPRRGRPKPHPMRPKDLSRKREHYGNAGGRTPAEVKALLRRSAGR